jgi:uncharacterized secreted protein with C-terminal beta-propeller domain
MAGLAQRSWFTLTIAVLALVAGVTLALLAILSAGGSGVARAAAVAKLTPFGSCNSVRGYLQRHRDDVAGGAVPDLLTGDFTIRADAAVSAAEGGPAPVPASATNVQEAGVDEPDIVKTDGTTLFALTGNRLRAVSVAGAAPAVLGSIELPGGPAKTDAADGELLVSGDRALVITRSYGGFELAYSPTTILTEVDISDPAAMRELSSMRVDGSYVSARLTGATARVAISAYPEIPLADRGHGRAWMPRAVLRDRVTGDVTRRNLTGCDDVRHARRYAGTTMLSVLTIDLERGLPAIDTDAVMTGGETVYASPSSLYIATERYADGEGAGAGSSVTTAIHRFDITDPERTEYAGSGTVVGYMLSQWSMSEHEGVLRVASTTAPPWQPDGGGERSESYVTTLVPRDDHLVEVGRLGGIGRGEQIYAVRFIGPTGYVVTFRQLDPLHVIDLADPAEPRLAGELHIPGYSAYLHPVGPGLLLGIGQDASADGVTRGSQASLFDVSDPARPVRVDHVSLGRYSASEVEYDHHAFMWSEAQDLAIVPVSSYVGQGFHGAVGLRTGSDGLELAGRTAHGGSLAAIRRSLVIGDLLYTVSNRGVAVHDPASLERLALTPFAGS